MLTKNDILRLAEPIEKAYMDATSQLIINIARHLGTGKGLATTQWQIQKLAELQTITNETIEIIAANTGRLPSEVEKVFREAIGIGNAETEKLLAQAAQDGFVPNAPTMEDSTAMRLLLQSYVAQAEDTFNLVNTVMLQSTLDRYTYIVDDVARVEALLGSNVEASLRTTQGVLNASTTNVLIGAESRNKALRDAIKELGEKGITGWIDRGGHRWTPEAYINMDIRTTVHNVAIQAQKDRSAEYGVSTFQISTHAAARPLCAPYQGWICSWDGSGGTVRDLYGKEYQVHSINETSYGEAAGIFGINCGHFPETFIDGYSIPRYESLTPEEEKRNAIEYAESQQQRQIEREIRQAKTEALAMRAAGDKEGFADASLKVRQKNAEYRDFCDKTGRTERLDRTQVYGYNRSTASKANWAAKKAEPPSAMSTRRSTEWAKGDGGINAEQLERLANYANSKGIRFDSNSFKRFEGTEETIREVIDAVDKVAKDFPAILNGRKPITIENAYNLIDADYAETTNSTIRINNNAFRNKAALSKDYAECVANKQFADGTDYKGICYHEAGHVVQNAYQFPTKQITYGIDKKRISAYATEGDSECIAEAFNRYYSGSINNEVFTILERCRIIAEERGLMP